MPKRTRIFCAGLIGWDTIGHTRYSLKPGADLPGLIITKLGGVIANIAVAITDMTRDTAELEIIMLSCTGDDEKSNSLLSLLSNRDQINCDLVIRSQGSPDGYVAIESRDGLFCAIASTTKLEKACVKIFKPLLENVTSRNKNGLAHHLIIDSNLTTKTLNFLSFEPFFNNTSIIIACASPFKARKIRSLLIKRTCIIYANLEEASEILGKSFSCSSEAAESLYKLGAKEAIVTNGKYESSSRSINGLASYLPKQIIASKVTGAGDVFLAAHFVSKTNNINLSEQEHLEFASNAATKKLLNEVEQ